MKKNIIIFAAVLLAGCLLVVRGQDAAPAETGEAATDAGAAADAGGNATQAGDITAAPTQPKEEAPAEVETTEAEANETTEESTEDSSRATCNDFERHKNILIFMGFCMVVRIANYPGTWLFNL